MQKRAENNFLKEHAKRENKDAKKAGGVYFIGFCRLRVYESRLSKDSRT